VRTTIVAATLLLSIGIANAQEQEKKMLDRLLKPEASLQHNLETKQFVAGGPVLTKKVATKPFWIPRRFWEKRYSGVKDIQPKEFAGTKQSRLAMQQANITPRNKLTKIETPYSTTAYVTRDSADSGKTVETVDYPATRPFLVRGKSQKALSAQNRTMPIDEVRELLNKNK
jgi:hypothetical protein